MKTPKERETLDLLDLVCQLSGRCLTAGTKEMHDAYWEARNELASRIPPKPEPTKDQPVHIDFIEHGQSLRINCPDEDSDFSLVMSNGRKFVFSFNVEDAEVIVKFLTFFIEIEKREEAIFNDNK